MFRSCVHDRDKTNEKTSDNTRPRKKHKVPSGRIPRVPDEVCLYAVRSDFDLSDLEDRFAWAESFQSDQERRDTPAHALAVAYASGSRTRAGGGARGRGRYGRRYYDDGPTGSSATDASRAATAPTVPSTTAAPMEAAAAAISTATAAETSAASAARSLGQLPETTSPTAVPDQSASQVESSCRAVRLLPLSPMDIARIQRWILDRVKLRDSTVTSRLCTCAADASTGPSLGIRLELFILAFPGPQGTFCAARPASEFGFE